MKKIFYLMCATLLCTACNDNAPDTGNTNPQNLPMQDTALFIVDQSGLYQYTAEEAKDILEFNLLEMGISTTGLATATVLEVSSLPFLDDLATLMDIVTWPYNREYDVRYFLDGHYVVTDVFYYVFNFSSGGFAVTTADMRNPVQLILYQSDGALTEDDFDIADIISTYGNLPNTGVIDSIFWKRYEMDDVLGDHLYKQFLLSQMVDAVMDQMHRTTSAPCNNELSWKTGPFLQTHQIDSWFNYSPYVVNTLESTIPLAILKMLVYHNYQGMLLSEEFDAQEIIEASNPATMVSYWVEKINLYLTTFVGPIQTASNMLLSDVGITLGNAVQPTEQNISIGIVNHHKLAVLEGDSHHWNLIDGVAQATDCHGDKIFYFYINNLSTSRNDVTPYIEGDLHYYGIDF